MNDAEGGGPPGRQHGSVVFSVEKNRNGTAEVDIELVKDFCHFRFDSSGRGCSAE